MCVCPCVCVHVSVFVRSGIQKKTWRKTPPLEEEAEEEVKIFPRNEEIKTTKSETKDSHTHTGIGEKKKEKRKKKTHILPAEERRT